MENEIISYIKERLEVLEVLASMLDGVSRTSFELCCTEMKFILARFDNFSVEV